MAYLRALTAGLGRYCRGRNTTYLFSGILLLVLLGLFSLTLLSFTSRSDSLVLNNNVQLSSAIHHQVPFIYPAKADASSTPKARILLLGYMRSGSTLTGDILQTHPKVFYFYEPLLYLWDHYVPSRKPYEKNLRRRAKTEFVRMMNEVPDPVEFLENMFTCNLTANNVQWLTNIRHSRPFRAPQCKYDKKRFYGVEYARLESCSALLQPLCEQSHTVVQKVVRMAMYEVEPWLQRDPHLKVIHLVRDPRGTFLSRMHFTAKASGEMHKNINNLCARIGNDLKVSQTLTDKYWGRILTVRYEDLSQKPEATSAMMYRFAGLEFLPSVKAYIKTITSSESLDAQGNPNKKSTSRKDPFSTAYHWREELSWEQVQKADRVCGDIYRIMGYKTYPSEAALRDLTIPPKREEFGEKLMTLW